MNGLMDPLKAPFSSDAASRTTPAKIAAVWAIGGVLAAVLLINNKG